MVNRQVGIVQPGQVVSGGGAGTGTGTVVKGGVGVVSGGGEAGANTKIISRKTTLLEKKIPVAATTEAKVDILAQMLGLKI